MRSTTSRKRRLSSPQGLVLHHELQVARDGRERRAQLVRHERHELVLEAVELPQAVVLLQQEALHRLRLRPGGALARIEPFPLTSDPLQLADDADETRQRQEWQDGSADDDADRVLDAAEPGLEGEHGRGGEGGNGQRRHAQAREARLVETRGSSQPGHRRVQRSGACAEVAGEPDDVDPRAGGVAARELQPGESRVGGDRAHHPGDKEREGGRGRPRREEQADEQREQEHVHQQVRGGERPLQQAQAGVGSVRLDQERPRDHARRDRDDRRVEDDPVRARVASAAAAG